MNTRMQQNQNRTWIRVGSQISKWVQGALMISAAFATAAMPAAAEDGWDFTVGVGVIGENVYLGSNDHYIVPMPSLKATYTKGAISGFASLLDGIGITYMNQNTGIIFNVGVNGGDRRNRDDYNVAGFSMDHSTQTLQLLTGSPNLSTSIVTTATLDVLTPVGIVGVSAGHYPTKVKLAGNQTNENIRHGFLGSAHYMAQLPITNRVSISGLLGLEYMDGRYADTWYSVASPTGAMQIFKADAGLRDAQIALQLDYQLSDKITFSAIGLSTVLLGDAYDSPYTVERVQRSVSLQTTYSF